MRCKKMRNNHTNIILIVNIIVLVFIQSICLFACDSDINSNCGRLYSLQSAYELGYLSIEDLTTISDYLSNQEVFDLQIDNNIAQQVKMAYVCNLKNELNKSIEIVDVSIERYLGTYGNCVAVVIADNLHDYPQWMRVDVVAGVSFQYTNGNDIRIYKVK